MAIYEDVLARLSSLGYTAVGKQMSEIICAINRSEEKIKANINCAEIPEGLHHVWVDMAAGMFLSDKKSAGQLGEGLDFAAPAKKITEGDVSIEFAGKTDGSTTPEARFDKLLNSLINPPAYLFTRFRRLVW